MEEEIHENVKLTEVEVAEKLLEIRSRQAGFLDTSFDTISGTYIIFISFFKSLAPYCCFFQTFAAHNMDDLQVLVQMVLSYIINPRRITVVLWMQINSSY